MTRLNDLLARRWFGVVLFAAFMLLWALLTRVYTHAWQEESRMATVHTLVEQGTFIDVIMRHFVIDHPANAVELHLGLQNPYTSQRLNAALPTGESVEAIRVPLK